MANDSPDLIAMIVDRDTPPDNRDRVVDHDIRGNPITQGMVDAFARPDLSQPQVEAESVEEDMRFQCLLYHYVAARAKMGDGTVTADDATDAFRELIAHIDSRDTARVAAERATIRDLDSIVMKFGAQLAQMHTATIKGQDYLRRDSVMDAVMDWRRAWDKNSAARKPFAASQAAPAHALPAQAVDYLQRKGLAGSPLRTDGEVPQVEAESVDTPEFRKSVLDLADALKYGDEETYWKRHASYIDSIITARVDDKAAQLELMTKWRDDALMQVVTLKRALAASQAAPAKAEGAVDAIADYVADNWPMRKYTLEEIETRLRAIDFAAPSTPAKEPT